MLDMFKESNILNTAEWYKQKNNNGGTLVLGLKSEVIDVYKHFCPTQSNNTITFGLPELKKRNNYQYNILLPSYFKENLESSCLGFFGQSWDIYHNIWTNSKIQIKSFRKELDRISRSIKGEAGHISCIERTLNTFSEYIDITKSQIKEISVDNHNLYNGLISKLTDFFTILSKKDILDEEINLGLLSMASIVGSQLEPVLKEQYENPHLDREFYNVNLFKWQICYPIIEEGFKRCKLKLKELFGSRYNKDFKNFVDFVLDPLIIEQDFTKRGMTTHIKYNQKQINYDKQIEVNQKLREISDGLYNDIQKGGFSFRLIYPSDKEELIDLRNRDQIEIMDAIQYDGKIAKLHFDDKEIIDFYYKRKKIAFFKSLTERFNYLNEGEEASDLFKTRRAYFFLKSKEKDPVKCGEIPIAFLAFKRINKEGMDPKKIQVFDNSFIGEESIIKEAFEGYEWSNYTKLKDESQKITYFKLTEDENKYPVLDILLRISDAAEKNSNEKKELVETFSKSGIKDSDISYIFTLYFDKINLKKLKQEKVFNELSKLNSSKIELEYNFNNFTLESNDIFSLAFNLDDENIFYRLKDELKDLQEIINSGKEKDYDRLKENVPLVYEKIKTLQEKGIKDVSLKDSNTSYEELEKTDKVHKQELILTKLKSDGAFLDKYITEALKDKYELENIENLTISSVLRSVCSFYQSNFLGEKPFAIDLGNCYNSSVSILVFGEGKLEQKIEEIRLVDNVANMLNLKLKDRINGD